MKDKTCKYCKGKFKPVYSTVQMVCTPLCAALLAKGQQAKKAEKEAKKKKDELKEKLKTLTDYENEAKKVFQKWVRLRDQGKPCISCGNPKVTDPCGGHFFPAGVYSGLIFDERNCHLQCNAHCNKFKGGNGHEYRKGLVNRYGEEFVKELEADSDKKRDYKYTKNELIAKRLQYELKIKEVKKKN